MGLPGSGKTTLGQRLEADQEVLLLAPDVWMTRVMTPRGVTRSRR